MLLGIETVFPRSQSIFDPASPATHSISNLAILVLAVSGVIFLVVEGILFYSIWRFRRQPAGAGGEPPQAYGSNAIEIAWTAAPTLIVLFMTLVIGRTLWEVEAQPPPMQTGDHALFVTVTGRQWWWEYTYDTYDGQPLGFATAGELHVPASDAGQSRTVHLILKSDDVCHSFWVPRLGGKVDLIPGRVNSLSFETDETGLFLGQCAEYCGTQHANMLLRVYVDRPADFDRWVAEQKQPADDDPAARDGREEFLAQSCVNCHRVRGTAARGSYAPDLTHLMSRQTLASGEIENNPKMLNEWVRDPQALKPGCLMPAFGLEVHRRDAIVRYLLTLH